MTTAKDLDAMVRAHYAGTPSKPNAGYFASEIQAPDSTRRADGLWLPLDGYGRGRIIGHEYKVTRSDVIAELSDPMKSHAWSKFCDKWWLVVSDPAILQNLPNGLSVPSHWGIMLPPEYNGRSKRLMMIVRQAEDLRPEPKADALATILARIYYNGDDQQSQLRFVKGQLDRAREQSQRDSDALRELRREMRATGQAVDQSPEAKELREFTNTIMMGLKGYQFRGGAMHYAVGAEMHDMTAEDALFVLRDIAAGRALASRLAREAEMSLQRLEHVIKGSDMKEVRKKLQELQSPDVVQ